MQGYYRHERRRQQPDSQFVHTLPQDEHQIDGGKSQKDCDDSAHRVHVGELTDR